MTDLTRDDILQEFVAVLNICQPEHPYLNDPYPATEDEIQESWCREDSWCIARCGPRSGSYVAMFAADLKHFQQNSTEHRLAVLVHEVTHVYHTSPGKGCSGHPPDFWREMAFHAHLALDDLEEIEEVMGEIDREELIREFIEEPNANTVDLRQETADERRQKMADLLGHEYAPE